MKGRDRIRRQAARWRPANPPHELSLDQAIEVLQKAQPQEIQGRGFHFGRHDYYSAVNDLDFLEQNKDLWHDRPMPREVPIDLDAQLDTVRQLADHVKELEDVPWDQPAGPPTYHWNNDFWRDADAVVHYTLLRHHAPRRVVEIGCGWSSLLLRRALERNERDGGPAAIVDQIEPFPRRELLSALPSSWSLHETILQRAPLEPFEALEGGDVCFYDGSHVARTASDVLWFFFEVLPRLQPGVTVHLHDIFWPADYPDEWIFDRQQSWNEQYLLQAFLMHNSEFEPMICNTALCQRFGGELEQLFAPTRARARGVSFWMRRKPAGA